MLGTKAEPRAALQRRLGTLQDEFGAAASSPQRFFDMFQPRQRTTTEEVQAQPPPPQIKQGGSFLQSLLRSNRYAFFDNVHQHSACVGNREGWLHQS